MEDQFNIFSKLTVGDKFRKNHLSLIPGGSSVILKYKSGKLLEYTNIKNMRAYLRAAFNDTEVEYAQVGQLIINRNDI